MLDRRERRDDCDKVCEVCMRIGEGESPLVSAAIDKTTKRDLE